MEVDIRRIAKALGVTARTARARAQREGWPHRMSSLRRARVEKPHLYAHESRVRRWAGTLSGRPGSVRAVMKHARAFWRFAVAEGWIDRSPMDNLSMPRDDRKQTQPLSRDEIRAMLRAAPAGSPERAMLLLMRYSGLAVSDAATLRPDDIRDGAVVVQRRKTSTLVCVPLPAAVEAALAALPHPGGYWFWTGKSEPVTVAKGWRERLKAVAKAAGVEGFHPHRLRDTFAVELLLDGVAIEDVAKLLGHSSVTMTERYYAPWNRARLQRLEGVVRAAHGRDPVLAEVAQ